MEGRLGGTARGSARAARVVADPRDGSVADAGARTAVLDGRVPAGSRRREQRRARRSPSTASRSIGSSSTDATMRRHRSLARPAGHAACRSGRAPRPRTRSSRSRSPHASPRGPAYERAAVVMQGEPGERAARDRVGVGRALPRQVRQEGQALAPRLPALRLGDERSELADRSRRRAASAASRRPRASRPSRARRPAPRGRRRARGPRARRDTRRARRRRRPRYRAHRQRPRPVDADAERARRLVAAPAATGMPSGVSPRHARRLGDGSAATPGRCSSASRPRRSTRGARRRRARCPRRRPRRSRAFAGEAQAHVVLGQEDVGDARVGLRLVSAKPQELRSREAGQRAVAGQLDEALEADRASISAHSARCAGRSRGSRGG